MDMQNFYNTVDRLFAEKKAAEAEDFMVKALVQAESDGNAAAVFTICNELGGFYRAVSKYEKGLPLYEKALQIIGDLKMEGSSAHGTTLINYATMCTIKGDKEKALQLYEKAADIFTCPGCEADFNLATLYNNMSFVCQDVGDFVRAEKYLLQALGILKTLNDSEIEIAITNTNLASLYTAGGRMKEAKEVLQQAVSLFLENGGDRDVHYAAAVSALGDLYYLEADYGAAAAQFTKALKLIARDYGTDNDNYRTIERNLQLCQERNR